MRNRKLPSSTRTAGRIKRYAKRHPPTALWFKPVAKEEAHYPEPSVTHEWSGLSD